ncbi:MAG: hypothetical protein HYX92_22420 [Chloroflexi bacterium]|nr:hypothetical protein [Chloroflexota bacterium]
MTVLGSKSKSSRNPPDTGQRVSEAVVDKVGTIEPGVPDDVFLCCSSFETRTLNAIRRFDEGYRTRRSFFVVYRGDLGNDESYVRDRHSEMIYRELSDVSDTEPVPLFCERSNPLELLDVLQAEMRSNCVPAAGARITLDISTFTKQHCLVLLRVLHRAWQTRLRLLYTVPLKYPDRPTRGVSHVETIPYFAGLWKPGNKLLLVVLLGLEHDRAMAIVDRLEPHDVLAALSVNPYDPGIGERVVKLNQFLFRRPNVDRCPNPLQGYSPSQNVPQLLKVFQKWRPTHNICLAPLGPKSQTLSVYLATSVYPEVQVVYATAARYDTAYYSRGSRLVYEYRLPVMKGAGWPPY